MGLLANIQRWAYRRGLARLKSGPKSPSRPMNLARAKTIGILFDGNDLDQRQQVTRYAEQLRKQNKRVQLLAYLHRADKEATYPFRVFSRKNVDWAHRPKGEEVDKFLTDSYDLFYCLTAESNPVFEYLAAAVNADLKIGPVAELPDSFDLMIDLGHRASPRQLIDQAEEILKKTNVEPLTV